MDVSIANHISQPQQSDERPEKPIALPVQSKTIREAFAALRWDISDSNDLVVAYRPKSGGLIHYAACDCADNQIDEFDGGLYTVAALYKPGSITAAGGRKVENAVAVFELPFDCDLKDYLKVTPESLYSLSQGEIEERIDSLVRDAREAFALAQVPIHRIRCSGYGIYVDVRIAPADQSRVDDIRQLHKQLIAHINEVYGGSIVDPQASDAATRLTRLPGSFNSKGTIRRSVSIIGAYTGDVRIDDFGVRQPHQSRSDRKPDAGKIPAELSDREVDLLVGALEPHWVAGVRHSLALHLPGWLAKALVPEDQAEEIVSLLSADDDDVEDRVRAVHDTFARFANGEEVSGYTGVETLLKEKDSAALSLISQILDAHYIRNTKPQTQERSRSIEIQQFPLHVLPADLREYVEVAARSLPVPPEMVAMPLLAYAGSLIGDRMHIVLKEGYQEYPTMYTIIVAPPGSAKTPALAKAQWPLDALQNDEMKRYRVAREKYESDWAAWRKAKSEEQGSEPRKPRLRSYFSTNLTIEWLIGELEHSPGISITSDEILSWLKNMNRYQKGADRQEFLSLWSARTIKCDRKGGGTVYRQFPVASVVGGIQPDRVRELYDEAQGSDGLIERFLPLVLECEPAYWNETRIDASLFAKAVSCFRHLDGLPRTELDIEFGSAPGISVRLDSDAKRLWETWYDGNVDQTQMARNIAQGFYRKLPAYLARFALILHALWLPKQDMFDSIRPVSSVTMQGAIELIEFFRGHIHRFLAMLNLAVPASADSLVRRIERILKDEGAASEGRWVMHSKLSHRLGNGVSTETLNAALTEALKEGILERRKRASTTKPAVEWRLLRQ